MNTSIEQEVQQPANTLTQSGEKNTAIGSATNFSINYNHILTPQTHDETLGKTIDELKAYREQVKLYEELGIINCTNGLKDTELAPLRCMPSVHSSLFFMGVGGEKWVKDEQLRKSFENMLRRTEFVGGEVRFLLINPASDAYSYLYQLRGESVPYNSYDQFVELIRKHSNLHVRLYNHMPSFRMQFVDDSYLAVSRYYFDKSSHEQWGGGWKIPHLIICNERSEFGKSEIKYRGSLFGSFLLAYNSIWNNGTDIKKWDEEGRKFNK